MLNNALYIQYADWILLIIMFLSFGQQLFSKKFNLYGIISLISLSSYIALHSVYSGLNTLVLILFIGAISLIILEMFIPGGIMGVFGIATLLVSLVIINETTQHISFILIVSILLFVVLFIINIYVFKNKLLLLNQFVLKEEISTENGYVAKETDTSLLGEILVSTTDLRPSGSAIFNGKKYDVVTEGDFIYKGTEVEVINVEGMRIVVKKK